ncbi:hypothetical protein LZ30DRAFT_691332 [Colletotrichum cereale]|nr:hypothetical protein LZ30DRAFT_691332 [Colletotrichum cereale]
MLLDKHIDVRVTNVFAVREHDDGRQPIFIDEPFLFVAKYKPSSSVLFRLSVCMTNSASTKTVIYLQITPDCIASLSHDIFDKKNDTSRQSPPCLELVRRRLGGIPSVIRFQLQLRNDHHTQLIVPTDFTFDEAPNSPARRSFASATSLTTASSFSLYMPHNALPMTYLKTFGQAVREFPTTSEQCQANKRIADLSGLYGGKGGIVFTPDDQSVICNPLPGPDKDCERSTTPATTASYATTVPFDTPPLHRGSPPCYYDPHHSPPRYECPSKPPQQRARLDDTPISAESPFGECAPPEYDEARAKRQHSEEVDLRPDPKRMYSSTRNAQRPERILLSPLAEPDCLESRLMVLLEQQSKQIEQQGQYIEQLQEDMKGLQRRNQMLERQYKELEGDYCDLKNRQAQTEDTIESLEVYVGEVDDGHTRLEEQMLDVLDETGHRMEDCIRDKSGERLQASESRLEEMEDIKEYIKSHVAAEIDLLD